MSLSRRALVFAGPHRVELRTEELPVPGPGQLLARTLVSAISAGTELLAYRNQLPPDLPLDETLGALGGTFRYPFRYGYAQVGEVVDVGDGVNPAAWVGRRVFAYHPHASAFVAATADVWPVPEGLPSERAVSFANMETAVNLILDGGPGLSERVLVIGQGVVGLMTTALLARFPLSLLLVAEPIPARAERARQMGANAVIAGAADLESILAAPGSSGAPGFSSSAGVDLVYELSGNPEALDLALATAGHEARVVVGSWYGSKRAALDLGGRFHRRRLRLISSQVSHIGAALSARWNRERRAAATWSALDAVDTLPLVSHGFDLDHATDAYDLLDRTGEAALQVLLIHS